MLLPFSFPSQDSHTVGESLLFFFLLDIRAVSPWLLATVDCPINYSNIGGTRWSDFVRNTLITAVSRLPFLRTEWLGMLTEETLVPSSLIHVDSRPVFDTFVVEIWMDLLAIYYSTISIKYPPRLRNFHVSYLFTNEPTRKFVLILSS